MPPNLTQRQAPRSAEPRGSVGAAEIHLILTVAFSGGLSRRADTGYCEPRALPTSLPPHINGPRHVSWGNRVGDSTAVDDPDIDAHSLAVALDEVRGSITVTTIDLCPLSYF